MDRKETRTKTKPRRKEGVIEITKTTRINQRRRETAERAKMVLITKTKEQRKMEGTTERIMAPRRKVREAIRRGREPQEKTRMVREGTERRMTPRRRRMVRV